MSEQRPTGQVARFPPGSRLAIVAARWNDHVVARLLEGCTERARQLGGEPAVYRAPGAFELPTAARWLAENGRYSAVICLGCVIRGDTPHFEYVAGECARGVMQVSLETGIPVIFGVLTVNDEAQAIARAGGTHGHAGIAAAEAAAEMVALRRSIDPVG